MTTYSIIRHYQEAGTEVVDTGLTLEDAQEHCQRDDTSSGRGTAEPHPIKGDWFDGYSEE